jgi:hypothetical protein
MSLPTKSSDDECIDVDYTDIDYKHYHDLMVKYINGNFRQEYNPSELYMDFKKYNIIACGVYIVKDQIVRSGGDGTSHTTFSDYCNYINIIFIDIYGHTYSTKYVPAIVNLDFRYKQINISALAFKHASVKTESCKIIKKEHLDYIIKNDLVSYFSMFDSPICRVSSNGSYKLRNVIDFDKFPQLENTHKIDILKSIIEDKDNEIDVLKMSIDTYYDRLLDMKKENDELRKRLYNCIDVIN